MDDNTPVTSEPRRRVGRVLLVVALLAALVIGYALIRPDTDDDPPSADPSETSTPAQPIERPPAVDQTKSWCGLPEGDWNAAADPPDDAEWTAPYNLAGPVLPEVGPGVRDSTGSLTTGTNICFARNPLGAVMSAMWFLVDDENPAVENAAVAGGHVRIPDQANSGPRLSEGGELLDGQLLGYRLLGTPTPDAIAVELLFGTTVEDEQALAAVTIPMVWEVGDWVVDIPDGAFERNFPPNADAYTLWGPPEVAEGVTDDGEARSLDPSTEAESGQASVVIPAGSTRPLARVAPFGAPAEDPTPTPPYNALEQQWADGFGADQGPTPPPGLADFAAMSHAEREDYMTPDPALTDEELEILANRRPDECDGNVTVPCALGKQSVVGDMALSIFLHSFFKATPEARLNDYTGELGEVADDSGSCGNALDCAVAGVTEAIEKLGDTLGGVKDALGAITSFNPEDLAEEWARSSARAVVWLMDKITEATLDFASPAYKNQWWAEQYAITYGLALMVLAVMLLFIGARIGGRDGPVSGITLGREVLSRLPWAVPLMAAAPALMLEGQQLLAGLAEALGKEGNKEAGSAAQKFIDGFANSAGGSGGDQSFVTLLGGGLVAMIMLLTTALFGLIVLVELAFASWGASFFGLLVPFAIAFAIYPPWRKMLARLAAFLIGIWAMPFAINLVYWSTWSAVDGLVGDDDLFNTAVYVLVGTFMLAAAPILAPMVLSRMVPDHEGPSGGGGMPGSGSASGPSLSDHYQKMSQRDPLSRGSLGSSTSSPTSSSGSASAPAEKTQVPSSSGRAPSDGSGAQGSPSASPASSQGAGAPGTGAVPAGAPSSSGASAGSAGSTAGASSGASTAGASAAAGVATGGVTVAATTAAAISAKMQREAHSSRNRWARG